ncbi:prepilin peptidase, partial [Candidatus Woesearchaeota archaeon]|nr:prepilin peptidase [Candidatus Woesearchaeota archaeon]
DLKKREVADWINYGLAAFGIGAAALASIAFNEWRYIAYSTAGLALFFGIAYLMFHAGQWGGGDSKMLIALGAVFGLEFTLQKPYISINSFLISFWLNLLIAGVAYALLWSAILAAKNRKKFTKELKLQLKKMKKARLITAAAAGTALIAIAIAKSGNAKAAIAALALLAAAATYLTAFSKAVEKATMLKMVKPAALTEGDWIAKNVIVAGKKIAGPKDLGATKKQIAQLKRLYALRKIKNVQIKTGVPFIPSFLIAYAITLAYGNVFLKLLELL